MPRLNRRRFLQFIGAASAIPMMPALPASAAASSGAASASKALWASLYANAGSTANFVSTAKSMGLSNAAIKGVGARSIGTRITIAAAEKLAQTGVQPVKSADNALQLRRTIKQRLERFLEAETEPVEQDIEAASDDEKDVSEAGENASN